jgi:hypothetical protein
VAGHRHRFDAPAAAFHARIQPGGRILVIALIPIVLLASVAMARASGVTTRPRLALTTAVGAELTPTDLPAAAADALEVATTLDGTGYTFEIVQHGTIVAKPDGPAIEAPDPTDPAKTVEAESAMVGTYLERGTVTPAGFHAEIRRGPEDPTAKPEWDGQSMELAALVVDGTTYRNDGEGWYATDRPPGIGLDPATAALLPTMLRGLTDVADDAQVRDAEPDATPEPGRAVADPFAEVAPARRLEGDAKVADLPGIIAVDLADSTELREPAELAFDDQGRLVGLRVLARNTHLDRYDLLVETVITFAYPDTAPELPKPEPAWTPPAAPAPGEVAR